MRNTLIAGLSALLLLAMGIGLTQIEWAPTVVEPVAVVEQSTTTTSTIETVVTLSPDEYPSKSCYVDESCGREEVEYPDTTTTTVVSTTQPPEEPPERVRPTTTTTIPPATTSTSAGSSSTTSVVQTTTTTVAPTTTTSQESTTTTRAPATACSFSSFSVNFDLYGQIKARLQPNGDWLSGGYFDVVKHQTGGVLEQRFNGISLSTGTGGSTYAVEVTGYVMSSSGTLLNCGTKTASSS